MEEGEGGVEEQDFTDDVGEGDLLLSTAKAFFFSITNDFDCNVVGGGGDVEEEDKGTCCFLTWFLVDREDFFFLFTTAAVVWVLLLLFRVEEDIKSWAVAQ